MRLHKYFLLFLLLYFSAHGYAYEPPHTSVEKAVKGGFVSFVGKINQIEELENEAYGSVAVAHVEVIQPFYGVAERERQTVKIKFHSKLSADSPYPGFPMSFSAGDVILFVFNGPVEDTDMFYFNSYLAHPRYRNKKMDLAYRIYDGPNNTYSPHEAKHYFASAYGLGDRYEVESEELFKWTSERASELARMGEVEGDEADGHICIAAIPEPNDGPLSLGNPVGGGRDFNFSVQIDDGETVHLEFKKSARYENLSLKSKHIVKIRRSGKIIESFWFSFKEYQSSALCLWFKPLYETWSLWELEDSRHMCECDE
jgi:hypothetical protein